MILLIFSTKSIEDQEKGLTSNLLKIRSLEKLHSLLESAPWGNERKYFATKEIFVHLHPDLKIGV
jgi:hypothetical protein